ncbi:MAG: carbamate kinase [bacterium]
MTIHRNESPIALVALGGHAFMERGQKGTIEEHETNAAKICDALMLLVERGYNIILTHGNGPQVGNRLLQNEMCKNDVPPMPLDVLVAETEGSLGYILQQAMLNQLRKRSVKRYVLTVVSQVQVDPDDPAFDNPTKPIGPFLSKEEALRRARELDWDVVDDAGRGWRRRVPSPKPVKIVQRHTIRDAAIAGHIVIAGGGGGIPIMKDAATNEYKGVEAVIDKDFTSALLAYQVGAELFVILTEVPQVYLHYNKPEQRALGALTVEMVSRLVDEGHFPPGSMGPKIEAIINYLNAGGKRALITNPASLPQALDGAAGTHFVGRC